MKEQLLRLIDEAELLRATAEVNGNTRLAYQMAEVVGTMQWAYNELTRYE